MITTLGKFNLFIYILILGFHGNFINIKFDI